MNTVLLLLFPILLIFLLFTVRLMLLWYERQLIRDHAKKIYMGSLNYIKGNTDPHDLDILTTREAFYRGVIEEHKVYAHVLLRLKELLQSQDVTLQKSFDFLLPHSK